MDRDAKATRPCRVVTACRRHIASDTCASRRPFPPLPLLLCTRQGGQAGSGDPQGEGAGRGSPGRHEGASAAQGCSTWATQPDPLPPGPARQRPRCGIWPDREGTAKRSPVLHRGARGRLPKRALAGSADGGRAASARSALGIWVYWDVAMLGGLGCCGRLCAPTRGPVVASSRDHVSESPRHLLSGPFQMSCARCPRRRLRLPCLTARSCHARYHFAP